MLANHAGDSVAPIAVTCTFEMPACKRDGRRQVVEGARGPDAEIMKPRGKRDLLERVAGAGRERRVEIHHAIGVIPIRGEVVAQLGRVHLEHAVERTQAFEQHHYAGR